VVLGIRPEHLEDASLARDAAPGSVIEVTVELREELGSEVDLHCAVGVAPLHPAGLGDDEPGADGAAGGAGGAVGTEGAAGAGQAGSTDPPGTAAPAGPVASALAATIAARMDPRTTLQVGERARVQVDLAALHFFDPETGASLRG
jgi:multiple sugar transport system ATP-binding protein